MAHHTNSKKTKTGNWLTIVKRSVLALVAGAVALTFSQTGNAQAPCTVSRGQDPLDVLDQGVRHNVWVVLDHSGSMDNTILGGQTKMEVATNVLTDVMTTLVDASGRPRVNWGYVRYDQNSVNQSSACNAQFTNNCVGLLLNGLIEPPTCDDPSNVQDIIDILPDPRDGTGSTPNGISMDQISNEIVNRGFVANLLPNQKNFILLLTDGDDTCECGEEDRSSAGSLVDGLWTPTPMPPFASTEIMPRSLRGDGPSGVPGIFPFNSSFSMPVGTANADEPNIRAMNAGTKGRLAYERLNPTAADRANGAKGGAFVIGLGLGGDSPARAHHMAWEASGAFYGNPNANHAFLGDDAASLRSALLDAISRIGIPTSEVALGGTVVGTVREVIPNYTNTFLTAADHIGDVGPANPDTDDVRGARLVRSDHRHNVLFSSTVELPGFKGHFRAHNVYEVMDDASRRTARQADFTQIWDAGEVLQATSPDARNLLFNRRGETILRPFDINNVTAADLGVAAGDFGALTDDDARDMVVQVVRGYRLSIHPLTGTYYQPNGDINFSEFEADGVTKTWKLYETIATPAVMPSPTRSPDFDPPLNHQTEYGVGGAVSGDGFFWDHFNRQTMVYLPTNGGIMHGFDAGTGVEVFGYIPDDVLGLDPNEVGGSRDTLKDFVKLVVEGNNGIGNHKYLLAGSPTVGEAFLRSDRGGDDNWHTMLTFGRGRAGRFVSGLDVTDPRFPELRFNVGNREGISNGALDGLGETWSTPVMGNVYTGGSANTIDQWVAFLGGGYGCDNGDDEGQFLFALRLENGAVHWYDQVTSDASAIIPHNALVAMPRLYNPHQEDAADANDYVTRVYIGDVQGNIWKLVSKAQNPNNWVLERLAQLGDEHPLTAPVSVLGDVNSDDVYVMAGSGGDSRVDSRATGIDFKFVALIDRDAEGAASFQYPLGMAPFWEKDVNPEERVYTAPVTIGEFGDPVDPVVFFAASKPFFNAAICRTEFSSSLFALGVTSGLAEVDLDGGGNDESVDLGAGKVTGLYARNNELYVSESGGLGAGAELSVYGDGDFSDDVTGGASWATVQVLVDSFRVSPF